MNYEEIIERLLDEKHITAKEASYLLRQCEKQPNIIHTYPIEYPDFPGTWPQITYTETPYTITCSSNTLEGIKYFK